MKSPGSTTALCGRLFIGVAAALSLYLACMALAHTNLAGCVESSACQDVLVSRWAYAFGVPVSFPGFVLYAMALLWSWAFVRRERTLTGFAGGMAVATIIAGAVWFTALQIFVLHSYCIWCSATHALAVTGALLLSYSRLRHPARASKQRGYGLTAAGAAFAGVGLLALGAMHGKAPLHQAVEMPLAPPGSIAAAPAMEGGLALLGGKFQINPASFPALGNDTATHTAVLLNDYTCSWCRQFHSSLDQMAASGQPSVRIILLPAARTPEAADVQRILLTLYHADRNAWRSLSALLTSGQIPAKPDAAGRAAIKLAGSEKWAQATVAHAAEVDQQLALAAAVMNELHAEVLPQLLCGSRVLAGTEHDPAKLQKFLQNGATTPAPPTHREPRASLLVLNSDVHLDDIEAGEPHEVQIKVSNRGDAPLSLGWLALEQDCEVTALPAKSILPGEIAVIGLRLTPPASGGDFSRTIKIHSSAPGTPGIVTVRGSTAPRVAAKS